MTRGGDPPGSTSGPSSKAAANRANAAKSTGPKTARGRARSSQNARTHGLTALATAPLDVGASKINHRLISADDADQALAVAVYEAQTHLTRIRAAKLDVLKRKQAAVLVELAHSQAPSTAELLAATLLSAERDLVTLSGYERKALSRRKRALRALYD